MVRTAKPVSAPVAPAATVSATVAPTSAPVKAAKTPKAPKNVVVESATVPELSVESTEVAESDESIAAKLVDFNTKLQQVVTLWLCPPYIDQ